MTIEIHASMLDEKSFCWSISLYINTKVLRQTLRHNWKTMLYIYPFVRGPTAFISFLQYVV